MVGRAAWERLSRVSEASPVKFSIVLKTEVEGAFGRTVRHFSSRNIREILSERDRSARRMHRLNRISANEVRKVFGWVNTGIALFTIHETFEWTDGLWLRCVSFLHFV